MDIATVLSLVEFAISEEPQVEASLRRVFSKPEPTPADWEAERVIVSAATYEGLVPNTKLPPSP